MGRGCGEGPTKGKIVGDGGKRRKKGKKREGKKKRREGLVGSLRLAAVLVGSLWVVAVEKV